MRVFAVPRSMARPPAKALGSKRPNSMTTPPPPPLLHTNKLFLNGFIKNETQKIKIFVRKKYEKNIKPGKEWEIISPPVQPFGVLAILPSGHSRSLNSS